MKAICLVLFSLFLLKGNTQDRAHQLDSFFTKLYKDDRFNGNVLIAEKGKVLYRNSFGSANHATKAKLDSASVFELASLSKQFTAMGIMLLKKQGKLDYSDSLRHFFPELPYSRISIRQILNHTSGLPDYMKLFANSWDSSTIANNRDMIGLLVKHQPPVQFSPGEKFSYSNTGYALLASIIEKVSGLSFGEFLSANIFQPLGMNNTLVMGRRYEKKQPPNYAFGYVKDEKENSWILPDDFTDTKHLVYILDGIQGDGTVNSTTGDLLRWDRALYSGQLVSNTEFKEALLPVKFASGKTSSYGFGWFVEETANLGTIMSHSGGWPGYATYIERHTTNDVTIILLTNHDQPLPSVKKIRNIIYRVKDEPSKEIKLDESTLRQFAGQYELMPDFILTISIRDGRIFAQATGQGENEIFPESETTFFLKVVEAKLKFEKDAAGKVQSLILLQGGQEVPGKKIR